MLEGKVEAAYQTILHIAKDKNFKGLKIAILWKLVETCIIPIITYGAESRTTTHKESQKIQTIMNKAIRDGRPRPPRHQVGWDIVRRECACQIS